VDGQVLAAHDVLGIFDAFTPKFVKRFANIGEQIVKAFEDFRVEVEKGSFPGPEHCYGMPKEEVEKLQIQLK
jgi:3-methyl-2-oxobutanoate hydroxymethyltransferase